ncbi:MAG: DEAD/DEAH box helicase, partial [Candidatus Methanofastidiosia archaeon]
MLEEYYKMFKLITGFEPYKHQEDVMEFLFQGKSIILHAPTGSGKSESVLIPFMLSLNERLPSQMIYSLPVRTLVNDISDRFKKYANFKWINVVGHHGKRVETPLFYPPIIITTIDQTIGAYACTPLSMSVRHGNIPAGAVSSAFLVFDEVHTFDPKLAFQSSLLLAKHSETFKLPFVFMSATMPNVFIKKLKEKFKKIEVEKIEANEKDIPRRKNRNVIVYWENKKLDANSVIEKYEETENKLIVVCNTVGKAQDIYKKVKDKVS